MAKVSSIDVIFLLDCAGGACRREREPELVRLQGGEASNPSSERTKYMNILDTSNKKRSARLWASRVLPAPTTSTA